LNAIAKYGSIEFRYFPTCSNAEELVSWINLVQSFAAAAEGIGNLGALTQAVATEASYNAMLNKYFQPFVATINQFVSRKEAKLALEEIISASKGEDADADSSLAGEGDALRERVLEAHPYLKKLVKKRARTANREEVAQAVPNSVRTLDDYMQVRQALPTRQQQVEAAITAAARRTRELDLERFREYTRRVEEARLSSTSNSGDSY
jgi:hypothetical protein